MDWPLAGAVTGVVVLAGAVSFGTVLALRATPEPPKKAQTFVLLLAPPPDTAGYTTASLPPFEEDEVKIDRRPLLPVAPITPPAKKSGSAGSESSAKPPVTQGPHKVTPAAPGSGSTANQHPLQVAPERWRVTTTSKASYFNLGGHVDKTGIVDSMASEHLRDAFKKHRNFEKLPPDIKTHINNSQTINLVKLAPYRTMLGVNDRWLEEEQGVRFERIASSR
jgi:hypothetical protein